jgi:hypothetical protein
MRSFPLIAAMVAIACSDSFRPGSHLSGTWSGADHRLVATDNAATLISRCFTVQSGPLVLTDSLTFEASGVVTQAGGLITLRVGDPYTVMGRLLGSQVQIGQDLLRPGAGGVLVCNA